MRALRSIFVLLAVLSGAAQAQVYDGKFAATDGLDELRSIVDEVAAKAPKRLPKWISKRTPTIRVELVDAQAPLPPGAWPGKVACSVKVAPEGKSWVGTIRLPVDSLIHDTRLVEVALKRQIFGIAALRAQLEVGVSIADLGNQGLSHPIIDAMAAHWSGGLDQEIDYALRQGLEDEEQTLAKVRGLQLSENGGSLTTPPEGDLSVLMLAKVLAPKSDKKLKTLFESMIRTQPLEQGLKKASGKKLERLNTELQKALDARLKKDLGKAWANYTTLVEAYQAKDWERVAQLAPQLEESPLAAPNAAVFASIAAEALERASGQTGSERAGLTRLRNAARAAGDTPFAAEAQACLARAFEATGDTEAARAAWVTLRDGFGWQAGARRRSDRGAGETGKVAGRAPARVEQTVCLQGWRYADSMKTRSRICRAAFALALASAPVFAFQGTPALEQVAPARVSLDARREAILETAKRFATVRWTAEERHAFHGEDMGVRIDTPDVSFEPGGWKPGAENVGMPYSWGGFTSLEHFEAQLAGPTFAGHVPLRGNAMGSMRTVGVDCSGYVSRCWGLPQKQSTRSLGALCYELDDYSELEPGDIVNSFDAHVALFTGWTDNERTTIEVLEAGRLRVEPSTYTLDRLRRLNFRPMRYKPLDRRWQAMPEPVAGRDTLLRFRASREFLGSEASELDPLPAALQDGGSHAGDWTRYGRDRRHHTWMAAGYSAEGELELQHQLSVSGEVIASGQALDLTAPWPETIVAFGGFSNPLQDIELVESEVVTGVYRVADTDATELSARRVKAVLHGNMLSRSTLYPFELEVETVISDAVPLLGICEARFVLQVAPGPNGEQPGVRRAVRSYVLTAFGRR